MTPKVFISYSWSSPAHKERVKAIADRLLSDGVDVVIDIYDLKEGYDKNAFMEKMVVDKSITNVLVMCDSVYVEKADNKKSGVGTESQIISQQVYTKVEQSKFIPIVCEYDEHSEPYLPVFMGSLIWIDLSTPEKENHNWERLVRHLNGKPADIKPKLGQRPSYLDSEQHAPVSEPYAKLNSLKQAILQNRTGVSYFRRDFVDAVIGYLDGMRVRTRPEDTELLSLGKKIISDVTAMKPLRDYVCEWIALEAEFTGQDDFSKELIRFLEKILLLTEVPSTVTSYQPNWFDAQKVFAFELFLYSISKLIKLEKFQLIRTVLSARFLSGDKSLPPEHRLVSVNAFLTDSETLQAGFEEDSRYYSPVAEFIKRNADREDIVFGDLIQADLLILFYSFCNDGIYWYPNTIHYVGYNYKPELFIRATQHQYFEHLAIIAGIASAQEIKLKIKAGAQRVRVSGFSYGRMGSDFESMMNAERLDSIK
ncbi:SEFIR domain-containing protein [Silvania hatchlandensis]|uniref:TIR domain-containing protein n=1 Tax=Silvania hatchlandensis TaxID=2926469 RepID=A0A9J6Q0F8_9ENTR|nr:TIR domain-containing protein [Silvania hatchlandensis]MCU6664465.1 TIR domain-containing protein [Silvania hatchlandensis]